MSSPAIEQTSRLPLTMHKPGRGSIQLIGHQQRLTGPVVKDFMSQAVQRCCHPAQSFVRAES